jgi:hypothetical protein
MFCGSRRDRKNPIGGQQSSASANSPLDKEAIGWVIRSYLPIMKASKLELQHLCMRIKQAVLFKHWNEVVMEVPLAQIASMSRRDCCQYLYHTIGVATVNPHHMWVYVYGLKLKYDKTTGLKADEWFSKHAYALVQGSVSISLAFTT